MTENSSEARRLLRRRLRCTVALRLAGNLRRPTLSFFWLRLLVCKEFLPRIPCAWGCQ